MIRVLFLLSAFTPHPASTDDVQFKEDILADRRYRFCHEDDYPLIESERGFCALIRPDDSSCPSLAKACQNEPREVDESAAGPIETKIEPGARAPAGKKSGEDQRREVRRVKSRSEGKSPDSEEKPDKPNEQQATPSPTTDNIAKPKPEDTPKSDPEASAPPPPPKRDPETASIASGFARILFFGLLGLFIAYIVRMVIKNIMADSDALPEDAPGDEPAKVAQTAANPALRGPIETDVERLLARARAAAQKGAFAQAIDDLYAALLRRLDGDGIINIQPFRTNGDYLREVRRERSEIAPDVRAILSDVESVHFGSRSPSAELFSRIHDRVVPLVSKALGFVFFILAISTVTSCGHLAASDFDESEDAEEALIASEPFRGDTSPSGIHGIVTLLEPISVDMRQHRRPLEDLPDPGISTLVLLPDFDIDDIGAGRLRDWVKQGGHLIFAGGKEIPEWAGAVPEAVQTSKSPAKPASGKAYYLGDISMPLPPGPLLRCEKFDVLLTRDSLCYAAQHTIEKGEVFVFADDRWFMNIALAVDDNASFLLSFFGAAHHRVHVLDGRTSMGANTPIDSITQSHMWPVILQLFLLLGFAILWRGSSFGTRRDAKVEQRRAFADHVRALGLAYARSGASRHVLGIYAGWAIERLRERLPREGRRGLSGLAEALAVRSGKSTGEVMSALVDLTDAQKETAPMSQRSVVAPSRAARKDKNQMSSDFKLFRIIDQWLASTSREQPKSISRSADKKTKRSP